MNLSKLLPVLCILLLSITIVSAVSFDVEIAPVKDRIFKEETAVYKIIVKNRERSDVQFDITSPEISAVRWYIVTDPFNDAHFILKGGDVKEIELNVRQMGQGVDYGQHQIQVDIAGTDIYSSDATKIENKLNIVVLNPEGYVSSYTPRIVVYENPSYPSEVMPLQNFRVDLHLQNKNSLNVSNAKIKVYSDFFSDEKIVKFDPYEKKTIPFDFSVGPFAESGMHKLNVEIIIENELITKQEFNINVGRNQIAFKITDMKKEGSIFKRIERYTILNQANYKQSTNFEIPVGFFKRIVSYSTPEMNVDDGSYIFDEELKSGESAQFIIVYKYWIYYLIVAFLLLLYGMYSLFKPDVLITRKIVSVKLDDDNTILGAKIAVSLKNVTNHTLQNVVLHENIPPLATYHLGESIVQPAKVRELDNGTDIIYSVPEIAGKGEFVVTYFIRAKTKLESGITLRPSVVEYIKGSKEKTIYGGELKIEVDKNLLMNQQ